MAVSWIEEFLFLTGSEDFKDVDFEKAMKLKDQHLPKSIFKFRAVNDLALSNLADGTVWFTSPSKYNDPYDCVGTLAYEELAGAVADAPPDFEHKLRQHYESIFSSLRESTKISSFCAANNPILMWSHYADNHRGFCMEYDVEHLPAHVRTILFPVIYDMVLFDYTRYFKQAAKDQYSFNAFFPLMAALYKAKEWEYEREWRMVCIHGALPSESNFVVGLPKAVHLGARISERDRARVSEICLALDIEVRGMKLAGDRFELISEQL